MNVQSSKSKNQAKFSNLLSTPLCGIQLPQEIQKQEHIKDFLLAPQTFAHLVIPHVLHPQIYTALHPQNSTRSM